MTVRLPACSSLLFFLVAACSGATPEAESPEASTPSGATEEVAEPEPEPEPEPEEPEDEGPSGPSGGRTPKDIVGAEGSRFVLNFNSSELGIKAGEECDTKHKSDPRKRNECVRNVRSRVKEDVLQFQVNPAGVWVWTTSTQRGSTLIRLRQTNFTWGAETKNSIELKPSRGTPVVLEVPNNYSIVFDHPTHGKLSYDSKRSD